MNLKTRIQLSIMMFIQFLIWGSWYAFLGSYMNKAGFEGNEQGSAFSTVHLAAIISPFFVGMVADRFFASEKLLAVMHLLGGITLLLVSTIKDPQMFYWGMLLHTVCFMPTLALVNAISFHQMQDIGKEFPGIRVLGTIGWIAAGWIIGLLRLEESDMIFKVGAVASFVMAGYSLFLPHTPPKSTGKKVTIRDVLGLDALVLLKERSFAVFIASSLLICIPLTFYYGVTPTFLIEIGMENVGGKMTFGQMSEIFFLLVMPFFFVRLGIKRMLLVGMLAWVVRYFLFAYGGMDDGEPDTSIAGMSLVMIYGGIILHGVCFDFFFVSGQIYIDQRAPRHLRASAQGFINVVTYGFGMYIGSYVWGYVLGKNTLEGNLHNWKAVWLTPGVMALIVMVAFAILFKANGNQVRASAEPEPVSDSSLPESKN